VINAKSTDIELSFSNFKAVDGLIFPFTTEIPSPMGGGQMTMEVDSIKLNPTIDEAIFKKPSKNKIEIFTLKFWFEPMNEEKLFYLTKTISKPHS
jgi:hypothetical protein